MVDPSEGPVTAVRVEWTGARYRVHLVRSAGAMSVVDGGDRPGDVLTALVTRGLSAADAEHCIREVDPKFKA